MKLYDQHVHSFLSSDTDEPIENYLKQAQKLKLTHFVTTEHLDLNSLYINKDDIFDIEKQKRLAEKFSKQYSIEFLTGVELGFKHSCLKESEAIIEKNNFDVVIMSVHETESNVFTDSALLSLLTPDEAYSMYLEHCLALVEKSSSYDILGHIDFLLRYIPPVRIEKHKAELMQIFNILIKKNKCLEFNTRFLSNNKDSHYLEYIFSLYYAYGGRKVSLGSDAHTAYTLYGAFDWAVEILKEIGFDSLCAYIKRKECIISI